MFAFTIFFLSRISNGCLYPPILIAAHASGFGSIYNDICVVLSLSLCLYCKSIGVVIPHSLSQWRSDSGPNENILANALTDHLFTSFSMTTCAIQMP